MKDNFTGRMFRRLWAPAMLSSVGWALSDMADAVVVGQKLGTVGLAAISLILPIYMINCMFAHGLGLGGSVRYSRLLGQGKTEEAVDSFNGVFWMALIFSGATAILGNLFMDPLLAVLGTRASDGALYTATKAYLRILVTATPLFYLSNVFNYYLRNDGSQKRAGAGSVIGNLCDIALNFFLVLGLNMGTRGAALSTALGQIIAILIYLPGLLDGKHILRFALPQTGWMRSSFSALKAGLATSVQYLYQTIFFLVCNNLLIRLGGETAVAVFDLIQNTSYLILYMFEGTGRAMQPILSTYQGEYNKQGKKNVARLGFLSGLAVGGILIVFVELWPEGMCLLFGLSGSSAESIAFIALRIYGVAAFFAGSNILLCSYYQACENEKPSFLLETLRGAVLLIPLTFLCYGFGLKYFWLLFLLTEAGALLVFLLLGFGGRYRRTELSEQRVFQKTILSNAENVMDVCQELEAFCETWGADMKQQLLVTMTIEEIGMAILKHGFHGRTDGYIQITAIMEEDGLLELHLRDDATTFNPFDMDTKKASLEGEFDMDSMGVLVIKKRAREFFYRRYQGFNTLIVKI
jgi:putative MATE family efflux protein